MSLHVAIAGWLLGPHSGANRRLSAILEHLPALLDPSERVTVLHRESHVPPALPRIEWLAVNVPASPTWQRVLAEHRELACVLHDLGANVLDHGFLPLPNVPIATCLLLHDLRSAEGFTRWPAWFARHVLRRSCERATTVVVPSEFTKARLRQLAGPLAHVRIVANGVLVPPAKNSVVREHLLHVGHVEPRKNLEVILRALALLPNSRRPPLYLVGHDTGTLSRLHALARRLGIPDALQWLGPRDDAATAELYATARAVVVPSRYEGFGLCALEGLAHGRPVMVAESGALPEVVGDAGTCLPVHDAARWAAAIASLADDEEQRARRRARASTFGWPAAAAAMLQIWRQLAHAEAAGRRSRS